MAEKYILAIDQSTTTIKAILFDRQAEAVGRCDVNHAQISPQQGWEKGMGKCTFGTGGSIMMNIGNEIVRSRNRIGTSIAWGLSGKGEYVFEGTIVCMGDTIKRLIKEMGFINNSAESQAFAGGMAVGFWRDRREIASLRRTSAEYVREMPDEKAETLYQGWKAFVQMLVLGPGGVRGRDAV